jgi:kynurenine formamidase
LFTASKDMADLELNNFLIGPAAVVDLSDATGDCQTYTPQTMVPEAHRSGVIEERVEVREGDILILYSGYNHFGWDQPYADEIRYMVQHPGPDGKLSVWCKEKKTKTVPASAAAWPWRRMTSTRKWWLVRPSCPSRALGIATIPSM